MSELHGCRWCEWIGVIFKCNLYWALELQTDANLSVSPSEFLSHYYTDMSRTGVRWKPTQGSSEYLFLKLCKQWCFVQKSPMFSHQGIVRVSSYPPWHQMGSPPSQDDSRITTGSIFLWKGPPPQGHMMAVNGYFLCVFQYLAPMSQAIGIKRPTVFLLHALKMLYITSAVAPHGGLSCCTV